MSTAAFFAYQQNGCWTAETYKYSPHSLATTEIRANRRKYTWIYPQAGWVDLGEACGKSECRNTAHVKNTLHQFSEHLLLPCSYPNPVPSLARIHLPVPPLPSHFAPLTVYSFCAALTRLLLQVEPPADDTAGPPNSAPIERWALMQKTPGNGLGSAGGEWFTAPANLREVEAARKKLGVRKEETLIETLAKEGNKFGEFSVHFRTDHRPRFSLAIASCCAFGISGQVGSEDSR